MDEDSLVTIFTLVFLILMSAYFSATETAFSAFNKIRIKHLAEKGSKKAGLVLKLSDDYDKLLSSILVGNNIVNLSAASIATVLFVKHFGNIGATLSTAVITVVVLIFSEISPKSLAKESPESFAMFSAPFMYVLTIILAPLNVLFTQWKKLLSLMFKPSDDKSMTEEELLTIVEEASQDGAINEDDRQLINTVIDFNDLKAQDILTPRVDVYGASVDAANDDIAKLFLETGYSRIPIYKDTMDNIIGVIHIRDFFELMLTKKGSASDIISPVIFIMPFIKINELLKLLQKNKSHLAVVTDEYGGTIGIVTMEDILEELVGEIWDEHDEIIEEFVRLADGTYKIICNTDIEKMFDYFNLTGKTDSSTVGGWIMDMLGKIPEEGDTFGFENLTVTVNKTDHRRVIECIIRVNDSNDSIVDDKEE